MAFLYDFFIYFLPLKHSSGTALRSSTHGLALLLHDLADLHGGIEELCGAAVEADGLALVELALAVVGRNALLLAGLLQSVLYGVSIMQFSLSAKEMQYFPFHMEIYPKAGYG